jgi:hypothetical protein
MTTIPTEIVSAEDGARLESIAAELQQPELTSLRRSELLEIATKIAEKYSCDSRLCE